MLKKVTQSLISLSLITSLLFIPLINVNAENNDSSITGIKLNEKAQVYKDSENKTEVQYSYLNNCIQEIALVQIDGETITSKRLIDVNGDFTMTVSDGIKQNIIKGRVNYNDFKLIADKYILNISQKYINSTKGNDITGSQFYHVYIGTSGPKTLYSSDLATCTTVLGVYSVMAGLFCLPAAAISGIASVVFGLIVQGSYAKVIARSFTYEVRFTADDLYYIHCYHQVYQVYDRDGNYIKTIRDFTQAIGG